MNAVPKKLVLSDAAAEFQTLASVARSCLDASDGNWEAAAKLMRTRLDKNPGLFRELIEPMIEEAIWRNIRHVAHTDRRAYSVSANADSADGLRAMALTEYKKWLDYPLSGGVKLGDAGREKLLIESEMHDGFARGNAAKAKWLAEIAKRIDGRRVRDVLTDQQVGKLWEKFKC